MFICNFRGIGGQGEKTCSQSAASRDLYYGERIGPGHFKPQVLLITKYLQMAKAVWGVTKQKISKYLINVFLAQNSIRV